ncbi:hypothetical protein BOO86_23945 [Mycobacterium sp. CBMA 234]|uniref:ankyrin repeat domain-containing protein n=1 Tax=Mycolicibacterium sp. CBMA 234 TaxID=1918495 RepID=UPI00192E6506|nr:ankyrin repeat domain-containing protein [Mycolicibacterium sp. CBMA 234]MUL67545.1 hypothetical protein [Mycolicibacterium sp. CBMA 234]
MTDMPLTWNGVLNPALINDSAVAASHALADAAKAGDWTAVFRLLDRKADLLEINWWRPGGTAWFTVLHQAAWHGASVDVADELIHRGALRTTVDSQGRTPYDVLISGSEGVSKGAVLLLTHRTLADRLAPPLTRLTPRTIGALDLYLDEVIDGRIRGKLYDGHDPRELLRYPSVAILHETPHQQLWFPVPGMYGGFFITLRGNTLDVRSWCRVAEGSEQTHLVTEHGATLVDGQAD